MALHSSSSMAERSPRASRHKKTASDSSFAELPDDIPGMNAPGEALGDEGHSSLYEKVC
jgi:hypothetical protein